MVHTTAQLHRCILPGRPPECCRLELYSLLPCGLADHICSSLLCILFLCRLPFLFLFLFLVLVHSFCILCIELFVQRALFVCLVLSSLFLLLPFFPLPFPFFPWPLCLLYPFSLLMAPMSIGAAPRSLLQRWMMRSAGAC